MTEKTQEKDKNVRPVEANTLNNPNTNNNIINQPKTQVEKEIMAEKEYKNLLNELHEINAGGQMTAQAQIKRLLGTTFINPYDVLMLSGIATEEEVRKQYKQVIIKC